MVADAAPAGPARAPTSWSPTAKAEFEALPAAVKEAVVKRETEMAAGLSKLADYKGLEPFTELAKQTGTTLSAAFTAYQAAEQVLISDFNAGIGQLCQTFGKHPVEVAAGLLRVDPRALAHALKGGQPAPQPTPQGQPSPQAPGIDPRVLQVIQQQEQAIRSLMTAEERRVADAQKSAVTQTQSIIDAFFDDPSHPYAPNLEAAIIGQVSRDPGARRGLQGALKRAYETAVWTSPETRELAIRSQTAAVPAVAPKPRASAQAEAAARARAGSRSLTGSPVAGVETAANVPAPSLREELKRAMRAA